MTENIVTEDGRKGEKVCNETLAENGNSVKVTELWLEPKPDKKLTKRVVEYTRPMVYRREIQSVDEVTGQLVDQKVEAVDNEPALKLMDHVVTPLKEYVTKEEMQNAIISAFKAAKGVSAPVMKAIHPVVSVREILEQKQVSINYTNLITWTAIVILGGILVYMLLFI